jgi:gentisate 1,2-dioxygenase
LLALRNQQRHDLASSQWLIRGDELPWEINPQGKMKWYMHPFMSYLACRTFVFYLQEISPHSRSGRVRQQGDQVIYFIKGSGHTILDGKSYPWKVGDMINVPIRPDGVELQHFNDGNEPAQFIAVEPNLLGAFGVDKGAGYEQLEVAPEYQTLAPG